MSENSAALTVIEVARDLGIEMSTRDAWIVGAAVRRRFEERTGTLPEKVLRTKTNGGGSHCFAVYPAEWRDEIAGIIRSVSSATTPQGSLF